MLVKEKKNHIIVSKESFHNFLAIMYINQHLMFILLKSCNINLYNIGIHQILKKKKTSANLCILSSVIKLIIIIKILNINCG